MAKLSDLNPNPKNPRSITEPKLKALQAALVEFGDLGGFVYNRKTKQLVGGHQRLKLFDANAPIVLEKKYNKPTKTGTVAEGFIELKGERFKYREVLWDSIREKAANIAANKGAGDWDNKLLTEWFKEIDALDFNLDLTMFDEKEREKYLGKESKPGLTDDDEIPDEVKPRAQLGQIWQLGNHRLMCGDSTSLSDVERLMKGEKAEMLFTDPPYGDNHAAMDFDPTQAKLGKSVVTKKHKIASDENLDFLGPALNSASTALADSATKIVFFKWKKWIEVREASEVFGEPSACIVWDRDDIAAAIMRFNPCHEFAFHWGSQTDKHSKSNLRNVWRCQKEYENKALHPTVKPIEILAPAIEVCTDAGDLILDLFGGSGSTLIACEKTNRKCFMMELDPHYCDVIVTRWEQFTGQKAKLLNNKLATNGK
jgi:DNA modification methylase